MLTFLIARCLPRQLSSASPRVRYECVRLLQTCQLTIDDPQEIDVTRFESYDILWSEISRLRRTPLAHDTLKTSNKAWEEAGFESPNICRSGTLAFRQERSGSATSVFQLQLNPLKNERSCRFFRKFGAHSFLKLSVPSISKFKQLESLNKTQRMALQERLTEWIAVPDKHFMGYYWSVFWLESKKKKTVFASKREGQEKRRFSDDGTSSVENIENATSYDVFLFATRGEGLTSITICALLDWLLPFKLNPALSICKAFSRIKLGTSFDCTSTRPGYP